jgi:hypothetical protein
LQWETPKGKGLFRKSSSSAVSLKMDFKGVTNLSLDNLNLPDMILSSLAAFCAY